MVELNNFSDSGNGHYAAAFGHDDMVMAEVQLTFVRDTLQYKLLRDEFEAGMDFNNDNVYNPYEVFDPYHLYSNFASDDIFSSIDIYEGNTHDNYRRLNGL
jgi:hypothetical protein